MLATRLSRLACLLLVLAAGCTRAPVTNRVQYNLIPDSIMLGLGKSAYQQTLSASKVEKTGEDAETLTRGGKKIAAVTGEIVRVGALGAPGIATESFCQT